VCVWVEGEGGRRDRGEGPKGGVGGLGEGVIVDVCGGGTGWG
jgi:hypothetical protein